MYCHVRRQVIHDEPANLVQTPKVQRPNFTTYIGDTCALQRIGATKYEKEK